MVKHNAESGDGTFGVSHNEHGIIVHVGSFKNIDRIKLTPEEAEDFARELKGFAGHFRDEGPHSH